MGNLSQRIQGEIPRPFAGKSILTCTIKNTISIDINPQRARTLVWGKRTPIPKRISATPLR